MTSAVANVELSIGTLKARPLDMVWVRESVAKWENINPGPEIPTLEMTPAHFKMKEQRRAHELSNDKGIPIEKAEWEIAKEIGTRPNPDDEEYQTVLKEWRIKRYVYMESLMISNSVLVEGKTLNEWEKEDKLKNIVNKKSFLLVTAALRDNSENGDRVKLYKGLVGISELTWDLVVEAAEQYGAKRLGKNILLTLPGGSSEPQTLISLGCSAARESNMPTAEYMKLPVSEQAIILAVWLSDRWREHFAYEKAKQEAKSKSR